MVGPASLDMMMYQGQTFVLDLTFYSDDDQTVPIDLTGYQFDMQVRSAPNAAAAVFTLSTREGDGTITVLSTAEGKIRLRIEAAASSEVAVGGKSLKLVYDLEMTDIEGFVRRVLQGAFEISPEVTRV